MLPVATVQLGCISVIIGAVGEPATALINTFVVGDDVHPKSFVTVKLKEVAGSEFKVVDELLPEIAPGLITQLPAGKPLKTTDPVDTVQSGCVIAPKIGVAGV